MDRRRDLTTGLCLRDVDDGDAADDQPDADDQRDRLAADNRRDETSIEKDGDVREQATKRDFVTGNSITVPVIVELESGGFRSGTEVSHPLPKRRQLPKRRAVKKVVGAIYEP